MFKNPEQEREYKRTWLEANPEYYRNYNLAHREQRQAYAREYYATHKEQMYKQHREWRAAHPEQYAIHQKKYQALHLKEHADKESLRRGRKLGTGAEFIDRQVVFDRDAGVCGICQETVDPTNWHLDHIQPLSKSGVHSYENVQVAHPMCNWKKSNKEN